MRTAKGIVGQFMREHPVTTFDRHLLDRFNKFKNKKKAAEDVYEVFGETLPTDKNDIHIVMTRRRKDFFEGITDEDFKVLSETMTMVAVAKECGLVYHAVSDRARQAKIVFTKKARVGRYVAPRSRDDKTRDEAISLLKSGNITADEFLELVS